MRNTSRFNKNPAFQRSFTLIEVIVVIIIIAVLYVVAVASFSSIAPKRLDADARKILSDLSWARQLAVAKHYNYVIRFDTAGETYRIYRDSVSSDNEVKYQRLGVDLYSVSPGTDLRFYTFSDTNRQAGTADNNFTITLRREGKEKTIAVYQGTGYIEIP